MANKIDITSHYLVPKHTLLNEKDKKVLLEKYNISIKEMPKINIKDPAILVLKAKLGDVVKITRKSFTGGDVSYFRGVVDE